MHNRYWYCIPFTLAYVIKYYIAPNKFSILMDIARPQAKNKLTLYILDCYGSWVFAPGILLTGITPEATKNAFSTNIKLLTTIFLRLVQMIIAPLGIFNPGCRHCQTR